jgi:hypothetical protein
VVGRRLGDGELGVGRGGESEQGEGELHRG